MDSVDTRVLWSERAVGIRGYGTKEENHQTEREVGFFLESFFWEDCFFEMVFFFDVDFFFRRRFFFECVFQC